MESRPDFTNPLGDLGVTINGAEAVKKLDAQVADPLSIENITKINSQFEADVAAEVAKYVGGQKGPDATGLAPAEMEEQVRREVAKKYLGLYGIEVVGQVSTIAPYLPQEEAPAEEGPAAPTDTAEYVPGENYSFGEGGQTISGDFLRMENGLPVFKWSDGTVSTADVSNEETPVAEQPVPEDDPQAAAIAAATEPGGNVADFVIRGGVIPQTLKLKDAQQNEVQYWFKEVREDGDKSYAVFENDKMDEQLVPMEN
jgi:hypothetical protein